MTITTQTDTAIGDTNNRGLFFYAVTGTWDSTTATLEYKTREMTAFATLHADTTLTANGNAIIGPFPLGMELNINTAGGGTSTNLIAVCEPSPGAAR